MCGIAGVAQLAGPLDPAVVHALGNALVHRGPDQGGTYFYLHPPLSIGLATRRLAILDLSPAGDQPMATPDGTVCIAYNGEVYNEPALRRHLEARGFRYRSRTDTETVLYAYQADGLAMLPRLNGMFAIALFDARHPRLVLARDRMGIKPLYYHWDGRRLIFASELRALLRAAGVPPRPDPVALDLYLSCGYVPSPYALIDGVRKLPPGSSLVLDARGAPTIEYFWEPPYPAPNGLSRATAEQEVRAVLEAAIQRQMRSDVPVGVLLSGGVDSTIVATTAARYADRPLATFSIAFRSAASPITPEYNADSHFARRVAAVIGTDHYEVVCDDTLDVPGLLRELAIGLDEPVWEPSFLSIYLMSRLARERGVRVLLTGDGSDELFAGYPWIAGAWRQEFYGRLPLVPALAALAARLLPPDAALGVHAHNLHTFLSADDIARYEWSHGVFSASERHALTGNRADSHGASPLASLLTPLLAGRASAAWADTLARLDLALWVREHFNQRLDRMTMLNSVESRVPFQDNAVVELALRLPFTLKARAGRTKRLLRDAFRDQLPAFVLRRPKRPFAAPAWAWAIGALREFMIATLAPERLAATGLIDPAAAAPVIAATRSTRQDRGTTQLWTLLMLQLWAEGLAVRGTPARAITQRATPARGPAAAHGHATACRGEMPA